MATDLVAKRTERYMRQTFLGVAKCHIQMILVPCGRIIQELLRLGQRMIDILIPVEGKGWKRERRNRLL